MLRQKYFLYLLATLFSFTVAPSEINLSSSGSTDCNDCCDQLCSTSKNTFQPRPFGSYASREILEEKTMYTICSSRDEWNGTLAFASEYMQNLCMNNTSNGCCKSLGIMPFWSGTNTMTLGNNNGQSDVDLYQFGLGNVALDAQGNPETGSISFNPTFKHVGTELLLHFVHKKDQPSFYFKIKAPLGAFIVLPCLKEDPAILSNATDYAWLSYPSVPLRYPDLSAAFHGGVPDSVTVDGNRIKPIGLDFGRISSCQQSAVRVGDIIAVLGFNFLANERGSLGLGFRASMPTGNVPTAEYIFEPIFGRAGHWGVGAEVMGHYRAYRSEDQEKYVNIWLQGELLHLTSGRKPSFRSFDLKQNGPGSKYLLLQRYQGVNRGTAAAPLAPSYSPSFITQAVNITTLPVISTFAVEGDVALMLDYHCRNWNLGIGGEVWGRSHENLSIDHCNALRLKQENLNDYAVLGRQISENSIDPENIVVLTLCEPLARINKSQDRLLALADPLPNGIADATDPANRIPAKVGEALDICSAQASAALTGKVFGQLGYTWHDHRYAPSISLFGGAEFTNSNNNALQFWSAGLQGSLNF